MFLRVTGTSTVAEGKVDPVHQFTIEPLFGTDHWAIAGHNIAFTNSALWMVITTLVLMVFVGGGANSEKKWNPCLAKPTISTIELISFLVRPFSLGLRLFVAMMAGHVLLEVLSGFVISGTNAGVGTFFLAGVPSFLLMIGICALELLVAGIQAYVFALLTCVYLNDAENLH